VSALHVPAVLDHQLGRPGTLSAPQPLPDLFHCAQLTAHTRTLCTAHTHIGKNLFVLAFVHVYK
jgi:hypothetical protein